MKSPRNKTFYYFYLRILVQKICNHFYEKYFLKSLRRIFELFFRYLFGHLLDKNYRIYFSYKPFLLIYIMIKKLLVLNKRLKKLNSFENLTF